MRKFLALSGGVQNLILLGALVAVLAGFGFGNPDYLSLDNFAVIGQTVTMAGLLAVAQTAIIICGGIDISVGSTVGLTAIIGALVFTETHNALLSIGIALLVGAACGVLNGVIIVYGRVNAIIATLAMLAAYKGIAQLISGGQATGSLFGDDLFTFVARGTVLGLPTMVWIMLLVAAGVHVLLKLTDIGRNIYALGGNATAARLAGININKYLISVYAMVGAIAAVTGIILAARSGSVHPTAGSEGLELKAITAAFLGGCAIAGGRGGIGGTLLAVVLLGALENGMTVMGWNPFWQNVAQGALLVFAVVVQQLRSHERAVGLPA